MISEISRTVSTCAIWLAVAIIFTFGLFRMNGSTEFFVITTFILAAAAAGATIAIWFAPGAQGTSSRPSARSDDWRHDDAPTVAMEEHGIARKPGM
jgi:hypothetical protein